MCDTKTGSFSWWQKKNEADIGGLYNWNELDMVFISLCSSIIGSNNTIIASSQRKGLL